MNKKNITLMVVTIATLITFVGLATYAYFVGNINTTRTSNVTATTERNNLVFDTNGGAMQLNVSAANMQRSQAGSVAAQNSTTLTVNLTANTDYSMVCTYDIIYEWTSADKYTAHSSGVSSNEFTIKASLASNSNTYEGTNNIANETDLSSLTYTNASTTVVSGAQIDATGSTMSTAVWTLESKIYNANANQVGLADKNYTGQFKVDNVSCVAGNISANSSEKIFYWFDDENSYTFPNYGGSPQASGSETGHNFYIKQDNVKYYTCSFSQMFEKEICLSQPYSDYGLLNHKINSKFTIEEQTTARRTLLQYVLDKLELSIDEANSLIEQMGYTGYTAEDLCRSNEYLVHCSISDLNCGIHSNGGVFCSVPDSGGGQCTINYDGSTHCNIYTN